MLVVSQLETGYGKKQVLFGLSIEVNEGDIVALIGPNGSGKSTALKSICGLLPSWSGNIKFQGDYINESNPSQNVVRGITFSSQGNRVFTGLTVMENLEIGGFYLHKKELKTRIEQVIQMFPVLKERSEQDAGKLSGGEQQMLAFARALVPKPKLLLLDEPSIGLSPSLVSLVFDKISEINHELGVTVLIVEQKVREVLDICNKVYSIKLGKVAFSGVPDELKEDKVKLKELFL